MFGEKCENKYTVKPKQTNKQIANVVLALYTCNYLNNKVLYNFRIALHVTLRYRASRLYKNK